MPTKPDDKSYSVTDPMGRVVEVGTNVMAGSNEYEAVGPAAPIEEGRASDVTDLKRPPSEKRRVRMQIYKWQVSSNKRSL